MRDVEELAKEGHSSHAHLDTVSSGQELIKEGYFLLYVCGFVYLVLQSLSRGISVEKLKIILSHAFVLF